MWMGFIPQFLSVFIVPILSHLSGNTDNSLGWSWLTLGGALRRNTDNRSGIPPRKTVGTIAPSALLHDHLEMERINKDAEDRDCAG